MEYESTPESVAGACGHLQVELSCLADGELHEAEAARAIAQLETCGDCRSFFDGVREQVRLHREADDAVALSRRFEELTGALPPDLEARQLVHRLASIFYQLGKAYALSAIDPGYRQRVFERAVAIDATRARARGFIDGVAARGEEPGGLGWGSRRHLLNGALERIESPLEKARRLLEESLEVEPDYENALLWLAFLDRQEGRLLKAARAFEHVFETAVDPANRGHAAMQLGKLHAAEGEHREALRWFRWVCQSGLADLDERFYVARFNVGLCHAHLASPQRAIDAFRGLLDAYPERARETAELFARSPELRSVVDRQEGFAAALLRACPELFRAPSEKGSEDPR
ncbi:MAG TPA: hypothetical protein VJP77_02420 [Planctomycetota bacterium]|nr:hypothetical protein [Planctomycetota bacterium]